LAQMLAGANACFDSTRPSQVGCEWWTWEATKFWIWIQTKLGKHRIVWKKFFCFFL
jgi:hypothetical protein